MGSIACAVFWNVGTFACAACDVWISLFALFVEMWVRLLVPFVKCGYVCSCGL